MPHLREEMVLVTGSNSFISYFLIQRLQQQGARVFGISRSSNMYPQLLSSDNFFQNDLSNSDSLDKIIQVIKPTVVFHLAAEMSKNTESLQKSIKTNFQGTVNLLNSLKDLPVTHFIAMGTGELYSGNTPYVENGLLVPKSVYSLTKYQASLLLDFYYRSFGFPATIVVPSVVYGPGQKKGMFIPDLISSLCAGKKFRMTKGEQTRDFVYVGDLIEALLLVINNPKAVGQTINIGCGEEYTLKKVALKVLSLLKLKPSLLDLSLSYRKNEQMRHCFDINKAKKILGWVPQTTLERGLKKTIDWYQENAN